MTTEIRRLAAIDIARVRVLLLDADGTLFGSEEPAYVASAAVTNRALAETGIARRYAPDELRRRAVGRNFRTLLPELAAQEGVTIEPDELERWVREERLEVTAHLRAVLAPDPEVVEPLAELAPRFELAVVSSSALARLDACFAASALSDLLAPERRFSAEDSLAVPAGKPDPAVYVHAGERLGICGAEGLAVEDAVAGALSAVAAGFSTVGTLQFVAPQERAERAAALREAGVSAIVPTLRHLRELLEADGAFPGSSRRLHV